MRIRKKIRINEHIRIKEVRLIANDGSQVGMVPTEDALRLAKEEGLDLVEVAPDARPPVCRIMDFNKLQYEKRQKVRESRKKARQTHLKEIKFRPTIDPHDLSTKAKMVRKFLLRGDKVKLTLIFRGRQIVHPEVGEKVLTLVLEEISDVGEMEGNMNKQGRILSALIIPLTSTPGEKEKIPTQ